MNHAARTLRRLVPAVGLASMLVLAACSLIGEYPGARGRVVVVLHRGYATTDWLLGEAEDAIRQAAAEGAALEAWILNNGSAAAMTQVAFSDAAGAGDLFPSSKNPDGWKADAERFTEAAFRDVAAAVAATEPGADATGADLVGALRLALERTRSMQGEGARRVILISGGGVHRVAGGVDLVADRVSPSRAARLVRRARGVDTSGVKVTLTGIGRFDAVDPPVDPVFANGVASFWAGLCPECTTN